jgi:hypothetical protein
MSPSVATVLLPVAVAITITSLAGALGYLVREYWPKSRQTIRPRARRQP